MNENHICTSTLRCVKCNEEYSIQYTIKQWEFLQYSNSLCHDCTTRMTELKKYIGKPCKDICHKSSQYVFEHLRFLQYTNVSPDSKGGGGTLEYYTEDCLKCDTCFAIWNIDSLSKNHNDEDEKELIQADCLDKREKTDMIKSEIDINEVKQTIRDVFSCFEEKINAEVEFYIHNFNAMKMHEVLVESRLLYFLKNNILNSL